MPFGYSLVVTKKVVHDEILWTPFGSFGRWAGEITFELGAAGRFHAPLNRRQHKTAGQPPVGSLKASIRSEMTHLTLRRFNIDLSANVFYAKWVHNGTGTIIARGTGGRFRPAAEGMYLPANLGYRARWRQRVSGQSGNPFLRRAWNDVSRHHSSMGRFSTLTV